MDNIPQTQTPAGATLHPAASRSDAANEIFDRYADSVIGCYSHHYEAVEVHGVRNFASTSDDSTCYEIDNESPMSYSVYVHLKVGGLDCVGDFSKYEDAAKYGKEIGSQYGWPVHNFVRTTIPSSMQ